jgi:hypothetical protein
LRAEKRWQNCLYLLLQLNWGLAIVAAPLTTFDETEPPLDVLPALSRWVRGGMLVAALLLIAVFAVAFWLNPYDESGQPLRMETHRQLGLPPCTFKVISGLPCPSCGMTSSFSLLVRGDVKNSLHANAVGTALALVWAAAIPWLLVCGVTGQAKGQARMERILIGLIVAFLALLLLRWFIVLGMIWFERT